MPVKHAVIGGTITDSEELQRGAHRDPPRQERSGGAKAPKSGSMVIRVALTLGGLVVLWGILSGQTPRFAKADSAAAMSGVAADDAKLIPDIGLWQVAGPPDSSSNFATWLRQYGVNPASKIEMDSKGFGSPSGSAYLLMTKKSSELKRAVWVDGGQVVYDNVDKIQGIARVPARATSHVSWKEGAAPPERPEGDGLLVIRDYTDPDGVRLFFVKNGKLVSGVPADLSNIELR